MATLGRLNPGLHTSLEINPIKALQGGCASILHRERFASSNPLESLGQQSPSLRFEIGIEVNGVELIRDGREGNGGDISSNCCWATDPRSFAWGHGDLHRVRYRKPHAVIPVVI